MRRGSCPYLSSQPHTSLFNDNVQALLSCTTWSMQLEDKTEQAPQSVLSPAWFLKDHYLTSCLAPIRKKVPSVCFHDPIEMESHFRPYMPGNMVPMPQAFINKSIVFSAFRGVLSISGSILHSDLVRSERCMENQGLLALDSRREC